MSVKDTFFEELYHRNHNKLENYCLHFVSYREEYRGIVDESIQETMLQAVKNYKALSTYTDAHTDAWLMNTCRKRLTTALRTYRRRKSRHAYSLNENISLPTGQIVDIIDEFFDQLHNHECVERIVAALNERESRIVDMRFKQNMSFREIAEKEHSTVAAIKAVLARLFIKIRKMASKNPYKFFIFTVSILFFMRFI